LREGGKNVPGETGIIDINYDIVADFLAYIDRSSQTEQTYLTDLKQFAAWLSYTGIKAPTRADIIRYRDYLSEPHEAIAYDPERGWRFRTDPAGNRIVISCKPATVAGYLQAVRRFFRWLQSIGKYPDITKDINPPKLNKDAHKRNMIPVEGLQAISAQLEARCRETEGQGRSYEQAARIKAIFYLCAVMGLRTVEISRARVKDIESLDGHAALWIWGKGHLEPDERKILPAGIYEAIKDYLIARETPARPGSPLFVATGNRSGGRPIAARTIGAMLKTVIRAAGYDSERMTAHSLRHSAGNIAMEQTGNNIFVVQGYLRHKDPKTTEIYLHRDTAKQEAALAEGIFGVITGAAMIGGAAGGL
jgi:integrase/recombinase XerC